MKRITFLLLLLLAHPARADSTVILDLDSGKIPLPWTLPPDPDSSARIRAQDALHGEYGLGLQSTDTRKPGLIKTGFLKDSWQRFYVRLDLKDSPVLPSKARADTVFFLLYTFSERFQKDEPFYYASFFFAKDTVPGSQLRIGVNVNPSIGILRAFDAPARVNNVYCVESHIVFSDPDSVRFEFWINGDSLWSLKTGYFYPHHFFAVNTYNAPGFRVPWRISLDELCISSKRSYTLPPRPATAAAILRGNSTWMACARFVTSFRGEKLTGVEWRLFSDAFPDFPLFDAVESDPSHFFHRKIPFPLDSGRYTWQARFRNNFNAWGDWSDPREIILTAAWEPSVKQESLYVSLAKDHLPLRRLNPGGIYRLNLRLRPRLGWKSMGYIAATLAHESYTLGHPKNFFGEYVPGLNYPLNISFEGQHARREDIFFYEKKERSTVVEKLFVDGVQGIYTLNDFEYDSLSGHFSLSFKMGANAKMGRWFVTAVSADTNGNYSNVLRIPVEVLSGVEGGRRVANKRLLLLILALGIGLFFFIFRKFRGPGKIAVDKEDPEFKRIVDYLGSHLGEDMTTEKVRKDLKLAVHQLYKILKNHKVNSVPQLLNHLRIQKAKELLDKTEKSVSEVGFEVGFAEARYFTKVFKDHAGLTPSEYKNRQKSL